MKATPLLIATLALAGTPAHAARPFVTDDARLTTAGSCQVESWMRIYPDSRELWALPACNPGGNFEVTFGGGYAKHDSGSGTADYVLQAKTLIRPLTSNDWGLGLAAGTVRHPEIHPGPNQLGNTYAYVPFSVSFADDAVVVHANLGWLRDRDSQRDALTWGIGGEFRLNERLIGIAEAFGDNHDHPFWQTGLRYAILPDLLQVDATVGQRFGGTSEERWISFGVRFTPERLF